MASINIKTGTIVGCKPYSIAWYHEKGHALYNNSRVGIESGVRQKNVFYLVVTFLIIGVSLNSSSWGFLSAILFLIFLYYEIKEEVFCWIYAFKNHKKCVKAKKKSLEK